MTLNRSIVSFLANAALLLLPVVTLMPRAAHADRDDRRDGRREFGERRREEEEMRRREEERHRWEREHPVYHEVIAPAPVVYVPPPPSPGISIVLPINIF